MRKILLIDDSSTVRSHLRDFLEDHGYAVFEAENGSVGVDMAREYEPDLFVVDVNMPVLGGIEAVERIRALPMHKGTPIFMLTTEMSAAMAARSKQAGATAWMVKPCRLDILLTGVRAVLERADG